MYHSIRASPVRSEDRVPIDKAHIRKRPLDVKCVTFWFLRCLMFDDFIRKHTNKNKSTPFQSDIYGLTIRDSQYYGFIICVTDF